mmetsp:Transcript_8308/g.24938  ORF Transcript_8308/g.24938 Transcript_8308/m.24938 type:complete len:383 (-) Transcript_8308:254-1402(-)
MPFLQVDHGPRLTAYSACAVLKDACAAHNQSRCLLDSFCAWEAPGCFAFDAVTHPTARGAIPCARGTTPWVLAQGSVRPANGSACRVHVHEPATLVRVEQEPAAMFYHWWRFFKALYARARRLRGGQVDARAHYIVQGGANAQFFPYFGLLSDMCWRRADTIVGVCFCRGLAEPARGVKGTSGDVDAAAFLVERLGLADQPEPRRVRMGLISRRRKRFLLNEVTLVEAALAELHIDVQVLPLEAMTLYEQLAAVRATTVLVGVHGSGLNNAAFMRPGTCLVQLLPFGLKYRGAFEANARRSSVDYREWQSEDMKNSVFHWEFLGAKELSHGRTAVLARGSPPGGAEVYTFWINQDLVVPVDDFMRVLRDGMQSPLNRKLLSN